MRLIRNLYAVATGAPIVGWYLGHLSFEMTVLTYLWGTYLLVYYNLEVE